ncbi:MAG: phosphoribosylformylglycinamidine synthase I [Candidatus Moranbacteria bacterium CG06_land_8_20_14_3_00_43_56]|nr:MAG: phosphoribosylformylglycinamidine synthase I [Candidatus Moranbacteria bacterium CG06_land_8_20_14_3_00_43_56]PJA86341.1 MAG: phosphoribosylformylglycinamidine synthase I [Candidatus Moranbacteria bacterium CG_4_9_14_3_um_filter_44_28]
MKRKMPKALVFSGYGLNCEEETKFAFEKAGARADIVHINDLIENKKRLRDYQILAFPGGFSYGDDTGSGKAYANKARNHLWEELERFVGEDKLAIGICNGFQIITNLGLLPGALTFNDSARYLDRWVDIKIEGKSPWLEGIRTLMIPIAHGEGKYYADKRTLADLKRKKLVAAKYIRGEICRYQNLEANPNGSLEDIAGVLGCEGRVLGMMPHPERAMFFHQLPHWPYLKEKYMREGKPVPKDGPGIKIFQNAVKYFK